MVEGCTNPCVPLDESNPILASPGTKLLLGKEQCVYGKLSYRMRETEFDYFDRSNFLSVKHYQIARAKQTPVLYHTLCMSFLAQVFCGTTEV